MKGLRAVLRRNRLMQKHIADALGVSRMTVWAWAGGRSVPSGSNLLRLLSYLREFEPGLQPEDLFGSPTAPEALVAPEPDQPDAV